MKIFKKLQGTQEIQVRNTWCGWIYILTQYFSLIPVLKTIEGIERSDHVFWKIHVYNHLPFAALMEPKQLWCLRRQIWFNIGL